MPCLWLSCSTQTLTFHSGYARLTSAGSTITVGPRAACCPNAARRQRQQASNQPGPVQQVQAAGGAQQLLSIAEAAPAVPAGVHPVVWAWGELTWPWQAASAVWTVGGPKVGIQRMLEGEEQPANCVNYHLIQRKPLPPRHQQPCSSHVLAAASNVAQAILSAPSTIPSLIGTAPAGHKQVALLAAAARGAASREAAVIWAQRPCRAGCLRGGSGGHTRGPTARGGRRCWQPHASSSSKPVAAAAGTATASSF